MDYTTERIGAISVHFISAFLDRYVKGDTSRAAYLEVRTPDSDDGVWPAQNPLPGPARRSAAVTSNS